MKTAPDSSLVRHLRDALAGLRRGQALAAKNRWAEAGQAFEACLLGANVDRPNDTAPLRRLRAIVWMNLGNARQQAGESQDLVLALLAYDAAIALLIGLDADQDVTLRNSFGASWMNRGRVLQLARDDESIAAAIAAHEQAIAVLATLPLDDDPAFRRNLAGAWLNLADAHLGRKSPSASQRAYDAAGEALGVVAGRETTKLEYAEIGLKARRARLEAIGRLLREPTTEGASREKDHAAEERRALAAEATDLVDDGLALAAQWHRRGTDGLRPLSTRLFCFGAQIYRIYQPQFLPELIREYFATGTGAASSLDPEVLNFARSELERALAAFAGPRVFIVGDAASQRVLHIVEELRATLAELDHLARVRVGRRSAA